MKIFVVKSKDVLLVTGSRKEAVKCIKKHLGEVHLTVLKVKKNKKVRCLSGTSARYLKHVNDVDYYLKKGGSTTDGKEIIEKINEERDRE